MRSDEFQIGDVVKNKEGRLMAVYIGQQGNSVGLTWFEGKELKRAHWLTDEITLVQARPFVAAYWSIERQLEEAFGVIRLIETRGHRGA